MAEISPKSEAMAFRIWQFAEPLEWDCSIEDIEAGTGIRAQTIGRVLNLKGWKTRIRAGKSEAAGRAYVQHRTFGALGSCAIESLDGVLA